MTYVNRDPFARTELHKERVDACGATCNWCGNVKRTPKGKTYLFQYHTESDGGRKSILNGWFCSVACFRDYHS